MSSTERYFAENHLKWVLCARATDTAAAQCTTCTLAAPILVPLQSVYSIEGVIASVYDQMFYLKNINQISKGEKPRQLIKF